MHQEHYFDQMTKLTAAGLPRREALRRFGAVLGGALLGSLGLGRAASGQVPVSCTTYCNTNYPIATKGKKANSACLSTCNSTACGGDPSKLCGTITPAPWRNTLVCCGLGQACNAGICVTTDLCAGVNCPPIGSGSCARTGTCNPATGNCVYSPSTDGNTCGPTLGCQAQICSGGNCVPTPAPNGTACDDSSACTVNDTCQNGVCVGIPVSCPPINNGTGGVCNPATGVCGSYTCNPGFASCDGTFGNGCETNTNTDLNNCGGCGILCSGGSSCVSGVCVTGACTQGTIRPCYTGPAGTNGIGICRAGIQTCNAGIWGPCTGQVLPSPEVCDGLDNDCDGQVDEGAPCPMGQVCFQGACTSPPA